MHLKIKILNESVRSYWEEKAAVHYSGDAGLDVPCAETKMIDAIGGMIGLGIAVEAIDNDGSPIAFDIVPRSSICKTGVRQSNCIGIIDAGYRGEIKLPLDLSTRVSKSSRLQVCTGDRLCQIVAYDRRPITFEIVDELSEADRGANGFGSTN